MEPNISVVTQLPDWLPDAARLYLDHTEEGLSLRALARREGLAASTVLRQIRRYEARREDPLVDEALGALATAGGSVAQAQQQEKDPDMTAHLRQTPATLDEAGLQREARRVLRRLAEPEAIMAIAADLGKGAVLRRATDGKMVQTTVLDRAVASAFAMKEWISVRQQQGRLTTYEITGAGRAELKRLIDKEDRRRMLGHEAFGLAESAAPFQGMSPPRDHQRRGRTILAESPVSVLARRRDKDGQVFLDPDLLQTAERLREDFELALMAGRTIQWENFIASTTEEMPAGAAYGPIAARARVANALRDLGPGLGDVVLRVCCFLEGLEQVERRMGWAARSGKIVLRIALQRLRRHYEETCGAAGPLIG